MDTTSKAARDGADIVSQIDPTIQAGDADYASTDNTATEVCSLAFMEEEACNPELYFVRLLVIVRKGQAKGLGVRLGRES